MRYRTLGHPIVSQTAFLCAGGEGGDIQVQSRRVTLTVVLGGAFTTGSQAGGTLVVNASDSVELTAETTPYVQIPTGLSRGSSLETTINTRQLSRMGRGIS